MYDSELHGSARRPYWVWNLHTSFYRWRVNAFPCSLARLHSLYLYYHREFAILLYSHRPLWLKMVSLKCLCGTVARVVEGDLFFVEGSAYSRVSQLP